MVRPARFRFAQTTQAIVTLLRSLFELWARFEHRASSRQSRRGRAHLRQNGKSKRDRFSVSGAPYSDISNVSA